MLGALSAFGYLHWHAGRMNAPSGTSEQAAAQNFIGFYRALDSGWEQYQTFPPVRQPQPAVIAAFTRLVSGTEAEKAVKIGIGDQSSVSH